MPELCDYIELDEAILQVVENDGGDFTKIKQVLLSYSVLLPPPKYFPLENFEAFLIFISELYMYQNSSEYQYSYKSIVREAKASGGLCEWPDCSLLGADKDHIFPKSTLKKNSFYRGIQNKKSGGPEKTGWDEFNSAWLCSRHNKNVKNDSIGIGIWLMARLER